MRLKTKQGEPYTLFDILRGVIFIIMLACLLLSIPLGCTTYKCYPSKKSRDYAEVKKLILRSDGWIHSIAKNEFSTYQAFYECLPDSVKLGSTVWVGNYQRIRTGGRLQVGVAPGVFRRHGIMN